MSTLNSHHLFTKQLFNMKLATVSALLLINYSVTAQLSIDPPAPRVASLQVINMISTTTEKEKKVKLAPLKWKVTGNHLWTGGLVFLAGASKGFNETLQFHWKEFRRQFPKLNIGSVKPHSFGSFSFIVFIKHDIVDMLIKVFFKHRI